MGTDIHGMFQRKDSSGAWLDVKSDYERGRHYQLFAVLAGVRNGRGFAGCLTGEEVTPIAEPRGLPADFVVADDDAHIHPLESIEHMSDLDRRYHTDDEPLEEWMGDHSHSWLSGAEMLDWYKSAPTITQFGVIGRAQYEQWDRTSRPDSYSGDVGGGGVIRVEDTDADRAEHPNWNYIRVQWQASLAEELAYFFDEVQRLSAEHGEVRFVFGFDS